MKMTSQRIGYYFVITTGVILATYISFAITKYFGVYVQEILSLSVIYLVYRYYFLPKKITMPFVEADRYQIKLWEIFEAYFLAIELGVAIRVSINMIFKLMRML